MSNLDYDLDTDPFGEGHRCFGCSPTHPIGFRLRFRREADAVVTRFTPSDQYQGPPGVMHGGLVTTLADEIGAWTMIGLLEKFGFTAAMSCRLHRPIRVGILVEGRGTIAHSSSRIVKVAVRLIQEGEDAFAGDFTFAVMDRAGAERILGGPMPEAWRKFAR